MRLKGEENRNALGLSGDVGVASTVAAEQRELVRF